jgi:hypothetical protein
MDPVRHGRGTLCYTLLLDAERPFVGIDDCWCGAHNGYMDMDHKCECGKVATHKTDSGDHLCCFCVADKKMQLERTERIVSAILVIVLLFGIAIIATLLSHP